MELFDTHAHLDDEQLLEQLDAVVERARAADVSTILTIGTTAQSSAAAVELADRYDCVYAAVGIQPNYVGQSDQQDWTRILELAESPRVVALGETGLDAYWDFTPFDIQQQWFDRHLQLSRTTGLPFIVHMRDCGDAVLDMLTAAARQGPLHGVMHSFSGDVGLAERCVELGLYISFAGMVTFKKSKQLREVARAVPADRLLIETDSPYLTPHPHRGRRPNEPAMIVHTAHCLAETRGVSLDQLAATTTANARRLFMK